MSSSPPLISSRPATMRRAVVLPQPDGPTSTRNSPSWMSSDRSWTAWKPFSYTFWTSLKTTSAILDPPDVECRAVRGEHAVGRILAVERLELREGNRDRVVRRARREAQEPLVLRLAQVDDGIVADVCEADPAARERGARAAQGDQPAV